MKGCIRRRGDTWTWYVYLGRDTEGKRKQSSKGGFRTKKDAQEALNLALGQLQDGSFVPPSRQSLGEFMNQWLPAVQHSLRPVTFANYDHLSRLYVLPHLGHVKLAKITPQGLNALYGQLLEGGGRNGRPLSRKSVQAVHLVIRRALADAVRWGVLSRNPASLASAPSPSRKEMQTWSAQQVREFLAHVKDSPNVASLHYTAYLLAVSTGMRRGEILGLRWRDLDLEKGAVEIQQVAAAYGSKGSLHYTDPKTKASRRQVALDPASVDALREWRKDWLSVSNDLVFTEADGTAISPSNFSQRFHDLVRRSGLPPIRFHDLRHTHATLALKAGVHPKVVQERLGHSHISITLGVYSHVVEGMQEEAAALVGSVLWNTEASNEVPRVVSQLSASARVSAGDGRD